MSTHPIKTTMTTDYLRDCTECGDPLSHDEAIELAHGTYCELHAADYDYEAGVSRL